MGRWGTFALRTTAGKARREKSALRVETTLAIGGKRMCGGAAYGSDLNCPTTTNERLRVAREGVGCSPQVESKQRKSLRAQGEL